MNNNTKIIYKIGDVFFPSEDGFKVICFPINNRLLVGQGFIRYVIRTFPDILDLYHLSKKNNNIILGENLYFKAKNDMILVSMICQDGKRTRNNFSNLDLNALKQCMLKVYQQFYDRNPIIICPNFITYKFSGIKNKEAIEKIIEEEWIKKGLKVIIYKRV